MLDLLAAGLGDPLLAAAGGESVEEGTRVLLDIVAVLGACVLAGLLARRLGQSVLVGYLVAGIVLGPSVSGIVRDLDSFTFIGEVGIGLLLFTIGLGLSLGRVGKVGTRALGAGFLQVALVVGIAAPLLAGFGLGWPEAIAVAMAVSLSSTAVVFTVLADRAETDSVHGLYATAILIAQDLAVIGFLLIIPDLGGEGSIDALEVLVGLGASALKLAGVVAAMLFIERVLMRRLFAHALGPERELLAVGSLVVCLGAIGACAALDLSPALGGFVAGLVMSGATYAEQVRSEIAPIRMGLVAVFFAYVGMLADMGWLLDNLLLVAALVLGVGLGKAAIIFASLRVVRAPVLPSVIVAIGLGQLGEFSFAIMNLSINNDVVSEDVFQAVAATTVVTLLMTPAMFGAVTRWREWKMRRSGEEHAAQAAGAAEYDICEAGHVVLVGAGPAGRAVLDEVVLEGGEVAVIELNPGAQAARSGAIAPGTRLVFGDATRPEILAQARVASARLLVVAVPDPATARTIIAQARRLAPTTPIVARGRYDLYADGLASAGADVVVNEERVTGRELAGAVRRWLVERCASLLSGQTKSVRFCCADHR